MYDIDSRDPKWTNVNTIVLRSFAFTKDWIDGGYLGLNELAQTEFGIRIWQNNKQSIVYSFESEQDYAFFLLKHMKCTPF